MVTGVRLKLKTGVHLKVTINRVIQKILASSRFSLTQGLADCPQTDKPSASFGPLHFVQVRAPGPNVSSGAGSVLPAPLTKKSVFRVPVGASEERQPRMMSDLSAPPSAAVHMLRSGSVYENATIYTHPNNAFKKAFRAAMCYFQLRKPIPTSLLADLEKFTL